MISAGYLWPTNPKGLSDSVIRLRMWSRAELAAV